jgi:serine/tyrosine/threonine adenylyltransferase
MNSPLDVSSWARPAWRAQTAMQALGEGFAVPVAPQPLPDPHWVASSEPLARTLGLDGWIGSESALRALSGHEPAAGRLPLATVYSGHQFGVWAGQLGDGRAHLLGEIDTPEGVMELQLKGCGLTPFSRMGDGRAVLRSSIREFLCSEAMHALGIPTTRALAIVGSALPVYRETVETAAVVTRVAPSFLRFGHFEHFCHHGQHERLRTLADAVIAQFYPECAETPVPALALLEAVARRTARLLADWQAVGFCHGVMNTDNMSILGLTIDYGPFGFLDAFDPMHVCNHSDHQGRYAYARQPGVAFWNLHALAQALLPLAGDDIEALKAALEPYRDEFAATVQARLRAKLGLATARDDDPALIDDFLRLLAGSRLDHTRSWRALAAFDTAAGAPAHALREQVIDLAAFDAWAARYADRLRAEASIDAERAARMNRVNPKYVLRNHLAETAIQRAEAGDFGEVQRLLNVLARPFDDQPEAYDCAAPPPDWAQHLEVSCSS